MPVWHAALGTVMACMCVPAFIPVCMACVRTISVLWTHCQLQESCRQFYSINSDCVSQKGCCCLWLCIPINISSFMHKISMRDRTSGDQQVLIKTSYHTIQTDTRNKPPLGGMMPLWAALLQANINVHSY